MKSIMYHYVRENNEKLPFFNFLHISDFKKQLDFFEKEYGIMNYEEILYFVKNKQLSKKILLTFDDGIIDHYDFVYPELKRRDLSGIFYVNTQPFQKKNMLLVHQIHFLLGKYKDQYLFEILMKYLTEDMILEKRKQQFKSIYIHQKNTEETMTFKSILNYFVSYNSKKHLLKNISEHLSETFDSDAYYMQEKHIQKMANDSMLIGAHSHSHQLLSTLSFKDQELDIEENLSILNTIISPKSIQTFCYPYGGPQSYNLATLEILKKNNIDLSFVVDPRDITEIDIQKNPYQLPRYDCNMFPNGQIYRY